MGDYPVQTVLFTALMAGLLIHRAWVCVGPPGLASSPSWGAVFCRREQKASLDDAGDLGAPVWAQPTGCVKRNAEGKLILKTDGWDNGKNCKDSELTVPQIFP